MSGDFIGGIIIGVFVVGVSAVVCPWLAHELIAPFIIEKVGMRDQFLDMAITVGVMLLLSLVLWKLGLTWSNVADSGGLWGILAGLLVVAWAGPERMIFAGFGIVASWLLMYLLNRHEYGSQQGFPLLPFLYIAVFAISFVAISFVDGSTEKVWEEDNFVWALYLPIFLVIALPMVSRGGFIIAEILCALGVLSYGAILYSGLTGSEIVDTTDGVWVWVVLYLMAFPASGTVVAYRAYLYGMDAKPERY